MLNPEQAATLAAYIAADPELSAYPHTSDGAFDIARLLNLPSNPAYIVWRTSVSWDEITNDPGFNWTLADGLSGAARIWEWLFANSSRSINPSKTNIRQGIIDTWNGSAPRLAVQSAVFGVCKRTASRLESVLAMGAGTTASPSVMGHEGAISYNDVQSAMGW